MVTTTPTWRTRDGREIAITELGDAHLRNILQMVERKAPAMRFREIEVACRALFFVNGDAAQDAIESDLAHLDQCDDRELMARDRTISALMDEAERRGVEW